jgi:hypothetical protein
MFKVYFWLNTVLTWEYQGDSIRGNPQIFSSPYCKLPWAVCMLGPHRGCLTRFYSFTSLSLLLWRGSTSSKTPKCCSKFSTLRWLKIGNSCCEPNFLVFYKLCKQTVSHQGVNSGWLMWIYIQKGHYFITLPIQL